MRFEVLFALAMGILVAVMFHRSSAAETAECQMLVLDTGSPGAYGFLDAVRILWGQTLQVLGLIPQRLAAGHVRRRILLDGLLTVILHTMGPVVFGKLAGRTDFMVPYQQTLPVLLGVALMLVVLVNLYSADRSLMALIMALAFLGNLLQLYFGESVETLKLYNLAAPAAAMLFLLFVKFMEQLPPRKAMILGTGLCVLMYLTLVFFGKCAENTQTKAWLVVGGFSFQLTELTKLIALVQISVLLSRRNGLSDGQKVLYLAVFVLIPHGLFLVKIKEMGTLLVIGAAAIFTLFLTLKDWRLLLAGTAVGVVGSLMIIASSAKIRARIEEFLHPTENSQAGIAAKEMLLVKWLGNMKLKSSVPALYTDFLFLAIAEVLGMAVMVGIALLYIALACRVLRLRQPTYGLAVVLQSLISLASSALGWLPVVGVGPALLSAGGTAYVYAIVCLAACLAGTTRLSLAPVELDRRNRRQ